MKENIKFFENLLKDINNYINKNPNTKASN